MLSAGDVTTGEVASVRSVSIDGRDNDVVPDRGDDISDLELVVDSTADRLCLSTGDAFGNTPALLGDAGGLAPLANDSCSASNGDCIGCSLAYPFTFTGPPAAPGPEPPAAWSSESARATGAPGPAAPTRASGSAAEGGCDVGSGFVSARGGGERTGSCITAVLFAERESGDGACTPRTTDDACETVARCGAAICAAAVVVVAIADLDRFVVI